MPLVCNTLIEAIGRGRKIFDGPDGLLAIVLCHFVNTRGVSFVESLLDSEIPVNMAATVDCALIRQSRIGEAHAAALWGRAREVWDYEDALRQANGEESKIIGHLARSLESMMNVPIPDWNLLPSLEWPRWARFKAVWYLDEFGDPLEEEKVEYATSAQLASLIVPMITLYRRQDPEAAPTADRILRWMNYWVQNDRVYEPGDGRTICVDGYQWEARSVGARAQTATEDRFRWLF